MPLNLGDLLVSLKADTGPLAQAMEVAEKAVARVEEQVKAVGEAAPAMEVAARATRSMEAAASDAGREVEKTTRQVTEFQKAFQKHIGGEVVAGGINRVTSALGEMKSAWAGAAQEVGGAASAIVQGFASGGPVGAAIGGITAAVATLTRAYSQQEEAARAAAEAQAERSRSAWESIDRETEKLREMTGVLRAMNDARAAGFGIDDAEASAQAGELARQIDETRARFEAFRAQANAGRAEVARFDGDPTQSGARLRGEAQSQVEAALDAAAAGQLKLLSLQRRQAQLDTAAAIAGHQDMATSRKSAVDTVKRAAEEQKKFADEWFNAFGSLQTDEMIERFKRAAAELGDDARNIDAAVEGLFASLEKAVSRSAREAQKQAEAQDREAEQARRAAQQAMAAAEVGGADSAARRAMAEAREAALANRTRNQTAGGMVGSLATRALTGGEASGAIVGGFKQHGFWGGIEEMIAQSKGFAELVGTVNNAFQALADGFTPAVRVVTRLGEAIGKLLGGTDALDDAFRLLFDGVKYTAAVINSFAAAVGWVVQKIGSWFGGDGPAAGFGDTVERAWNAFAGLDYSTLKLADSQTKAAAAAADFAESLTNIPSGFRVALARYNAQDTQSLPHFASGGIVTKPTVAVVGEAGPEAIVPLSGGRGGAMVHMPITVYTDDPERFLSVARRRAEREAMAVLGSPLGGAPQYSGA